MPDAEIAGDPYYERLRAGQREMARAAANDPAWAAVLAEQQEPSYTVPDVIVRDDVATGPDGPVPVRLYLPPQPGGKDRPLFVWCHGGGWVEGDLDMPEADATAREICARSGAAVVSVDYRLAGPGVHYPAPVDDALTVWRWAKDSCAEWGASARRAVLGGASAGGNIAAACALRLRDGHEELPAALALVYPALHAGIAPLDASQRQACGISETVESIYRTGLALMLENYAGAPLAEAAPYVIPGSLDPTGLPPTLIVTCEQDILRFSGEQFATSLEAAGVRHRLVMAPGVGHGHINTPWLAAAQDTFAVMAEWVSNS
jgi:acetyl esterase/lipase